MMTSKKQQNETMKRENGIMEENSINSEEMEINKILQERARELAVSSEEDIITEDSVEIVEFVLSYEKYAIESVVVSEVYPMKEYTTLPGTPDFVLGIINLRGSILSVIDIRRFFNLPVSGISNLNRVIVVESNNMKVGIIADFILGVRQIPSNSIQASLPTLTGIRAEFLRGITNDRLVILDIKKMLSDKKIIIHDTVD